MTGFTAFEISLNGTASATATLTGSGATYTATITPTGQGNVIIQVPAGVAYDATNNGNTASDTYTVSVDLSDESVGLTGPSVTITAPTATQTGAFDVTITFTEAVSDFVQSDLSLSGTATASITAWNTDDNTVYSATVTPTTSGTVKLGVSAGVAADAAGNKNTAATSKAVTVNMDVDKPTVTIGVPSGTQTGAFDVTITFSESVSGFVQSDVSLSGSAASITAWSANSGNTVYTATITPTASGTVTVSVAANVATDAAGNKNTAATSKTVTVNIPPPIPDPATWMPDANLRKAVRASLGLSTGDTLTQSKMTSLTELRAAGRGIRNITGIGHATNLTTARLANNKISSVSALSGLTKLTMLRLQNNQITNVTSLGGLVNLKTLRLSGNPFANSGANAQTLDRLRAAGVAIDIPAADDVIVPYGAPSQGEEVTRPEETLLLSNYPNPFNPETWIPYHLANDSDVQISIYDINGALVRQLDLGHQRAGYYINRSRAAYWDGRNEFGERVATGIYFYQLQADDMSLLRKMVILK